MRSLLHKILAVLLALGVVFPPTSWAVRGLVDIDSTGNYTGGGGGLPSGMIAFFAGACPTGWTEYTTARGRIVVGLPLNGTAEGTIGTALTDLQDKSLSLTHAGSAVADHSYTPVGINAASGAGTPSGTVAWPVWSINERRLRVRAWMIGLGLLFMVSTAEAATMTVTTSPDEDAAIAVLRDKMNAERPKPLSEQEYQEYMLRQWVDSQVTQGKALMVERYKQAAEQAPVEIQEQVKSLLICGQVVCK